MIKNLRILILVGLGVIAIVSLGWWQFYDPYKELVTSEPGTDNRIASSDSVVENIRLGSIYNLFSTTESELKETWPRFRGADFDNISKSSVPLIDKFSPSGPEILWEIELGEGHAGAAVFEGKAYVLDYNEIVRSDILRCFSLLDGKELWQRGYQVAVKRNHGMSRTVPAVTNEYVLTMGPRAHVMCLDRADGNFRWGLDIVKDYNSEIPDWYTGQCPLIDNNLAILATGGKAILIAVDCTTGEVLWETPNENEWKMSHSSVMIWEFGGRKMYVYSAVGGVCGIAADGPDAGKILWETSAWNHSVVAPSPLCLPDGTIFLTAGYGAGSMVIKVSASASGFLVQVVDEYKPVDGLASEQQTPVFHDGYVYAILPKDAGQHRVQFVCVHPGNFREIVWSSGKESRFGLGPYIIADGKFYILSDDGKLTIVQPSTTDYIQLDQIQLFDGFDAWAPIAVTDGYMLLRDSKKMLCINMNIE